MKGKFITISGILAALLSSACCIVPLLALVAGSAGWASSFFWLEPFRPWLMGLAVLALGVAWYNKLTVPENTACDCNSKKNTFWQTKTFLIILTVVTGLLLTFPEYAHNFYPKSKKKTIVEADEKHVREAYFMIQGMSCDGCAEHITDELTSLTGVMACTTSYEKGNSIVKFDETQTNPDSIAYVIKELGYEVIPVSIQR